MVHLASMVSLDSQGYQEKLVLLGSQDLRDHLAIEVNQDHQVCQELENQGRMVLEGNLGPWEQKENQALQVYQGVQECQGTENQGFQGPKVTRGMLVFLVLQVLKVIKVMEGFQVSLVPQVLLVCLAHQVQ